MLELLTVSEVAEILRVSYETALEYIKVHKLAIRVGRQYRVQKDSLLAHLRKQTTDPIKLKRGR